MPSTPFIGGAYKGRSSDMNAQVCINLYPEMDPMGAKNVAALYGTPGMLEFCDPSVTAEVRNCHVVNNSAGNLLYAVIGNTLYKITTAGVATAIGGNLGASTGFVFMADNGTELMIVEPDSEGYIYETIAGGNLTAIADADFPTPHSLTYQDGYFIVSKQNTGEFYISGSYDGTDWDALDYATAEKDPDYLEAVFADHGQLWLLGRGSCEVWYNSGATDFPFEKIPGAYLQEGIRAKASPAQLNESVFVLDAKNRVVEISGLSPKIVSTKHLEYLINGYTTKSDAIGFGYAQEGHAFYVLIFPSADKTWVYDMMSGFWHHRRSYPVDADGSEGRHRANCYAFFDDKHIIGDFENGKLYQWKMGTYTDDTQVIRRIRAAQTVHNDRKTIFFHKFEIDFESGVALTPARSQYTALKTLHDCGDTNPVGDWDNLTGDALTPAQDSTYVKEGTYSMKLEVDASKSTGETAWWESNVSWDLEGFMKEWIYLWVYFERIDTLRTGNVFHVILGNSATVYHTWSFPKTDIVVGWNRIIIDLANPDGTIGTMDYSALDYNWIGLTQVVGNTTDFSIYVDEIILVDRLPQDAQVMLEWSDDGGHTWGNEHWTKIGPTGQYFARAIWRRLGRSRNRIFRTTITDPIKVVMINAHLEAELGAS